MPSTGGHAWPQWGGPGRDFKSRATGLASSWPEKGPRQLWRRELGRGYSGIAAAAGLLFTMFRSGDSEIVVALNGETGQTVWEHGYAAPVYPDQAKDFGKGPNATPLIVGGRVYTVGFTSKMHCLDRKSGARIWSHDLIEEYGGKVQTFGYASSPLLYGKIVVVLVGGAEQGAVGFDLEDGSVRWKSQPVDFSYSSPMIIDVDGEDQLVFMTPTEVIGIAMSNGWLRWRFPHRNKYKNNCQGPWWGEDNLLFVSSQADGGGRTLMLTGGEGKTRVEQVARAEQIKFFHASAIRLGKWVYGASGSELVAHNIRTGKDAWRKSGFPSANLVYADGKMIVLDEEGRLSLATVSPQRLEVLASHPLMTKPAWTAPTLVGTRLFVRDTKSIVALELASGAAVATTRP
jgi:outer membrane protein assembly factor BamB